MDDALILNSPLSFSNWTGTLWLWSFKTHTHNPYTPHWPTLYVRLRSHRLGLKSTAYYMTFSCNRFLPHGCICHGCAATTSSINGTTPKWHHVTCYLCVSSVCSAVLSPAVSPNTERPLQPPWLSHYYHLLYRRCCLIFSCQVRLHQINFHQSRSLRIRDHR